MILPDHPKQSVSPQGSLYRDGTEALRQEAQRLCRRHRMAIDALRKPAEPVFMARCARIAAGWVLAAGAAALVVTGAAILLSDGHLGNGRDYNPLTAILLGTWPAAAVAFLIAREWAKRTFERHMLAPIAATADVHAQLERARRFDPGQHAMRLLVAMEPASMAPLLAGAAVLLPLTLHFLAGMVLDAEVHQYDSWIKVSAVVVGHCHVILAVRAWRYGKLLATVPTMALLHHSYAPGWKTYGIVLAASLFPGVLLLFVPVFLVAITGLFIPLLYGWAARRIAGERDALAMTTFHALSVAPAQP